MPPVNRTKISAVDFERNSVLTPAFTIESLSAPERDRAIIIADGAKALLLKALLHRHSPKEFPVSQDPDSLEAEAAAIVNAIEAKDFARIEPKIRSVRVDPQKIQTLLGGASHIDLRKPGVDLELTKKSNLFPAKPFGPPVIDLSAPKGPKFNQVKLNLRKMRCVDETDPEGGADSMILGALLVGAAGHTKAVPAFVAGDFDDGDVQDYGILPFGSASLRTTPGYPKNIYCIFCLVESDSDDQEVADGISAAFTVLATLATAVGQGIAAAAFAAVAGLIDAFAGIFIDEDKFPPYGIELRLNSENDFGSDGVDKYRRTGNISAHGGTYRIGFNWELVA